MSNSIITSIFIVIELETTKLGGAGIMLLPHTVMFLNLPVRRYSVPTSSTKGGGGGGGGEGLR